MCIKGLRLVTMQLPEKFSPFYWGPTEFRIFGFLRSSPNKFQVQEFIADSSLHVLMELQQANTEANYS
jgi:hypothetical protein